MSKYINAAELKLILNREHLNYSQMIEKKFVLNAIDNMPSADVVEVVRCKDCKYSESVPKWKDFELGCMLHREYTTATDFCSQAERKEDLTDEINELIGEGFVI